MELLFNQRRQPSIYETRAQVFANIIANLRNACVRISFQNNVANILYTSLRIMSSLNSASIGSEYDV